MQLKQRKPAREVALQLKLMFTDTASRIRSGRQFPSWIVLGFLESACAAFAMGRIAFGPPSASSTPLLWLVGVAAFFVLYISITASTTLAPLGDSRKPGARWHFWLSTLPFLAFFLAVGGLMEFMPGRANRIWGFLSPIQPFPVIAMAIGLMLVWLMKLLMTRTWKAYQHGVSTRRAVLSANVAIPISFVLLGILQASVYLIPIGNAFLRFWAITDGLGAGISYPVTLTEEGPMLAGSPPYVYDLPLFPLILKAAFALLGHNSAAAHLPAAVANALFPLSLYLLIDRATKSRIVAVLFTALASLFPYLRFWVLNLPDPDPILLTSACFAAYLYLRALDDPRSTATWIYAGVVGGILSLARPEGILYAGCLTLGLLLSRPRVKQFGLHLLCLALFVVPMVFTWMANFGFLWPQNYNRTLRLDYPEQNLNILKSTDALGFYQRGLGLDPQWALGLLALFSATVLLGVVAMLIRDRRLLAFAVPGIGNTVTIFFANPYIPNTFHFADFFRHDSFGIPFLVATSAYAAHLGWRYLAKRQRLRLIGYLFLVVLTAAVVREGDILANPTATHRPGALPLACWRRP